MVAICTESTQSDQPEPILSHLNLLKASQSPMPQPNWKQPQTHQSSRGQVGRDEFAGHCPSGEHDEDNEITQNDAAPPTAP